MHEDDERVAALDPGPSQEPSSVGGLTASDAAWPFPTDASVALARSVAPPGSCRYLHLQRGQADCLALSPAIAVSDRQVELMCLGPAHVHCPRFVHGGTGEQPRPAPTLRPSAVAVLPATRPAPTADAQTRPTEAAPRPTDADPIAAPDSLPAAAVLATTGTAEAGPTSVKPDDDVPRDRARPDAASDTAGLAALAAPSPAVPSHGGGELAVAAAAVSTTGVQGDAVDGLAVPVVAVPARTRSRPEGIRVSQAHERSIALRRSTIAATLVLVASIVVALAFVAARGGLVMPDAGTPGPSQVAVGSQAPASASAGAPAASTAPPTASHAPTASAAPPSTAPPTATHAPTASATPPGGSAGPTFSPAQLAVLKACPGKTDCWQYRIKSGDNLHGIAKFFGLTYAALLKANSQITNPSIIHVGQVLTIPLPTT